MKTTTARRPLLLAACVLGSLHATGACAQTMLHDGWMGLWCASNNQLAVVNYGVDPDTILRVAREQLPLARELIADDVQLVQPRHQGACAVPSAGAVRVTTLPTPFDLDHGNQCWTGLTHAVWVGPRRVLDRAESFGCIIYGLIVTPTMVFGCGVLAGSYADFVPPACDVVGPPRMIGRFDGSMFAPDGARRLRGGFALRFEASPGRCAAFIDWPGGAFVWPAFTVDRGRLTLTLRETSWRLAHRALTKVAWHEVFDRVNPYFSYALRSASFDFLGRGKADAVFRIEFSLMRPHAQFDGSFYVVVPGRGAETDAIAARLATVPEEPPWGDDRTDARRAILSILPLPAGHIVVDATGLSDHVEASELRVVRDGGVTWTVMQRRDIPYRDRNALVLSRVEKDGRQTPVCMYDRVRPPPFAPW